MTAPTAARQWPVLRTFDAEHLAALTLPLGGIGTGTVGLGGNGALRDWELTDRPAKGFDPGLSFFAIRTTQQDGSCFARVLEGPTDPARRGGDQGSTAAHAGLPRFTTATAAAAYPLLQVDLAEAGAPVEVSLQAFNPLVPGDAEASALPVAVLRYRVRNVTGATLAVSVVGSIENIAGPHYGERRTRDTDAAAGRSQQECSADGIGGILLQGTDSGVDAAGTGSIALGVLDATEDGVEYRSGWKTRFWNAGLLDFWHELCDGQPLRTPDDAVCPVSSVGITRQIPAGEQVDVTFVLGWHFPFRWAWAQRDAGGVQVGNHYAATFTDAWDVVRAVAPRLPELERRTVSFVRDLATSVVPDEIVEAALASVSVLRSQTVFRSATGHLLGWEGCFDALGSCHGSCTHVWNYEHVTGALFADLARTMREVEYLHSIRQDGLMPFRSMLPLGAPDPEPVAAADGQFGTLVRLYREWRSSGDDAWLATLWPAARRSLEFAWIPGGWDADRDGIAEGTQHNTMDIEYHGPNPEVGSWYLAALAAAAVMARHLGEDDFAADCARLAEQGGAWIDQHLFAEGWYRQQIRPPGDDPIADGLRLPGVGSADLHRPDFQLGDGCLIDQTVGQVLADLVGLGTLLDRDHQHQALRSILTHNDRRSAAAVAPVYRSYATDAEPGLVLASYPDGRRPARPFPYFSEVWTGLEHTLAIALVQAGLHDEALGVVRGVRSRYDGRDRNPFDEIECGHHYVRSMAAWGTLLAWSGVRYDAVMRTLYLGATTTPGTRVLTTGAGWGVLTVDGGELTLTMREGTVEVLAVAAAGRRWDVPPTRVGPGAPLTTTIS